MFPIPEGKHLNYFNTWEAVDALRSGEVRSNLEVLESSWKLSMINSWQAYHNPLSDEELQVERDRFRDITPIEALNQWVAEGNMPPPELLICVESCISVYMLSGVIGDSCDLEHVFFGPKKKGVGNYAQRNFSPSRRKQKMHSSFHMYVAKFKSLEQDHTGPTNYEDLAVSFFDEKEDKEKRGWDMFPGGGDFKPSPQPDIDNFLRGYRRWKKNNKSRASADK